MTATILFPACRSRPWLQGEPGVRHARWLQGINGSNWQPIHYCPLSSTSTHCRFVSSRPITILHRSTCYIFFLFCPVFVLLISYAALVKNVESLEEKIANFHVLISVLVLWLRMIGNVNNTVIWNICTLFYCFCYFLIYLLIYIAHAYDKTRNTCWWTTVCETLQFWKTMF